MTGTRWRRTRERLLAPAVAVVLGAVAVVVIGQRIVNPDGASYLAISRHWADGDWSAAVNGYWSPLLSLLFVPVDLLGISLVAASKAFSVLTAAAAIGALQRLMRVGGTDPTISTIGACPFVVFAALDNLTPDLLMATLLVLFVAEIVGGLERPWTAGLLGGAAFLAKAYALPFMIAYLAATTVAVVVWRRLRDPHESDAALAEDDRLRTARGADAGDLVRIVVAASVVGIIALGWSITISIDAGHPTFSTAAEYNSAITRPGSQGLPYDYIGMIEPDQPSAFWGWEDPPEIVPDEIPTEDFPESPQGDSAEAEATRPPSSGASRVERLVDNTEETVRSFALVLGSAIAAVIIVAWAVVSVSVDRWRPRLRGRSAQRSDRRFATILHLSLATAIYLGGLLVLVVDARYLFFAMLVVVAITGIGLSALADRVPRRMRAVVALAAVAALATAGRSGVALYRLDERADRINSIDEFLSAVDVDGRRVASSPSSLTRFGARCLAEGCVYLGAPVGRDRAGLAEQLDEFDVDVFVVDLGLDIEVPEQARLIAESDDVGYAIYDVSVVAAPS